MAQLTSSRSAQWSSRWMFIFAATASAVGLGNIWKFPYITGENGGSAFVLVYLLCITLIGLPILISEVLIGRRGGRNPIDSTRIVALESHRSRHWQLLGALGLITSFFLLSYYALIAGWAGHYTFGSLLGMFKGLNAQQIDETFEQFLADPLQLIFWQSLFMLITFLVVSRGIKAGLEKTIRVLVPGLFLILVLLVGYSMTLPGFLPAMDFLFKPDFKTLTSQSVLVALGHAFFTLSIATASMLIYGAYLSKEASIGRTTVAIAILDTLTALLAGIAIFPLVFSYGLEPGQGPTLVFKTLPIAFANMPGGHIIGGLFFLLIVLAALGSAISMIEPLVSWLMQRGSFKRISATALSCFSVWFVGLGSVLSFNVWKHITIISNWTIYQTIDNLVSIILLPLGGFLLAFFAGWIMTQSATHDELNMKYNWIYYLWRFLIRFITPIGVFIITYRLIADLVS